MAERAAGAGLEVARRDLVAVAVAVVALSRFASPIGAWVVAGLLAGALVAGLRTVLAGRGPTGPDGRPPVDSVLLPAVAAFGCVGTLRLVPVGLVLVPAVAVAAVVIDRTVRTETRIVAANRRPGETDRLPLLVETLVVAFLGFLGTAALVPGGLPEPGLPPGGSPLPESSLVVLAGVDAIVAAALGYRTSTLRLAAPRDALWSAATYASVVAIAAAALRATDLPRLIGPAMLTLVFFLWDAFHGAEPARRRDPRWLWQTALLAGIGLVVIVWNLGLR